MRVGIVCHASVGGSGVVASELARALAARGHTVHVISAARPFRLATENGIAVHTVEALAYPLFAEPPYLLALSAAIARIAREHRLDLIHAHYAVPHATAAYLAAEMFAKAGARSRLRVVNTLHGTDVTVFAGHASYIDALAFCINQSDGVTAVSRSLRDDAFRALPLTLDIDVVPNFVQCDRYVRRPGGALRERLCPASRFDALVVHVSNFRPVKRVERVLDIFERARREVAAKLLLIGHGPDVDAIRTAVRARGLSETVEMAGEQRDVVRFLSVADAFLLPSAQESFGLAALEAMACEVPVVASRVGGLPEVITDGVDGILHDADDVDGMAASLVELLSNPRAARALGERARATVWRRFTAQQVVPQYELCYHRVLAET